MAERKTSLTDGVDREYIMMRKKKFRPRAAYVMACCLYLVVMLTLAGSLASAALLPVKPLQQDSNAQPLWQFTLSSNNVHLLPAPEGKIYLLYPDRVNVLKDGLVTKTLPLDAGKLWDRHSAVVDSAGNIYVIASDAQNDSVYFISATSREVRKVFSGKKSYWINKSLTLLENNLYIMITDFDNRHLMLQHRLFALNTAQIRQHLSDDTASYITFSRQEKEYYPASNIIASDDGKRLFVNGKILNSETGAELNGPAFSKKYTIRSAISDGDDTLWFSSECTQLFGSGWCASDVSSTHVLKLTRIRLSDNDKYDVWEKVIPAEPGSEAMMLSVNSESGKLYFRMKNVNGLSVINIAEPDKDADIVSPPDLDSIPVHMPVADPETGYAYLTYVKEEKISRKTTYTYSLFRILPDNRTERLYQGRRHDYMQKGNLPLVQDGKVFFRDNKMVYAFSSDKI